MSVINLTVPQQTLSYNNAVLKVAFAQTYQNMWIKHIHRKFLFRYTLTIIPLHIIKKLERKHESLDLPLSVEIDFRWHLMTDTHLRIKSNNLSFKFLRNNYYPIKICGK